MAQNQEHAEQRKLIIWASWEIRNIPELALLFSIPNAGKRSAQEANWMIAEGLKAGVPDLFLAVMRHGKSGLFIEMKSSTGKLSENQIKWRDRLINQGYEWALCRSANEAIDVICRYLEITRKTPLKN